MRSRSQKRYDTKCPVISVRLTPNLNWILREFMKEGESYPDAIKRIIWKIKVIEEMKHQEHTKGFREGFSKGTTEAYNCFTITFPCSQCGEPVVIHQNDNAHKAIAKFLRDNGWRHSVCPR